MRSPTLVNLIYQMRNKIVHEFYDIGGELKFEDPREEPYHFSLDFRPPLW